MATTPLSLPGKSHGQKSVAGYNPWGCKELDMTKRLSMAVDSEVGGRQLHTLQN